MRMLNTYKYVVLPVKFPCVSWPLEEASRYPGPVRILVCARPFSHQMQPNSIRSLVSFEVGGECYSPRIVVSPNGRMSCIRCRMVGRSFVRHERQPMSIETAGRTCIPGLPLAPGLIAAHTSLLLPAKPLGSPHTHRCRRICGTRPASSPD